MNRRFRFGGFLAPLLVALALGTRCSAQPLGLPTGIPDSAYCPESSSVSVQVGGYQLPSVGTIRILMLFIDFPDDSLDPGNAAWPLSPSPTPMGGPSYRRTIIDSATSHVSHQHYNITNYFDQQSFGNLQVVGDVVYKQALHPLSWYAANLAYRDEIPYWAARHVLEYIDTASEYNVDFSNYDNWTTPSAYNHVNIPDGKVDFIAVCWRRWYGDGLAFKGGFRAQGWSLLSGGSSFTLDGGARTITSFSGVHCVSMMEYPSCFETPIHEFGHYLGLPHQYDGGVWSLMGQRNSNVSYCMNSFEREQMGWITFTDITVDGTTASIPDFATTGAAYRLVVPGSNTTFLIENHQGINEYDFVDGTLARGIYILRKSFAADPEKQIQVMNADGRWSWLNPDSIENPWAAGNYIPLYQRNGVMRDDGLTDRERIPFNKPWRGSTATEFIYAWNDERSGDATTGARKLGDGKDVWNTVVANMFSPWSNPSSAVGHLDTATSHVGVEIVSDAGGGSSNINVRFYTTSPQNGPPARPQDLRVWAFTDSSGSYPHLTWDGNLEPDLLDGGGYEIWRRFGPADAPIGTWTLIDSVGGTATSYVDREVDSVDTAYAMYSVNYRIRAFDSTGKLSTNSEERGIYYGADDSELPGDGGGGGCCIGGKIIARRQDGETAGEIVLWPNRPNPFSGVTEIGYSLTRAGRVIVDVFDPSGKRVAVLVDDVEQGAGSHRVSFNGSTLPAGVYLCRVIANGLAVAQPITLSR